MNESRSMQASPARSRLARIAAGSADALSSALSRFPFAVLAIGLLALFANLEIAGIRVFDERYDLRVVSVLSVGAAVAIAATLLFERAKTGVSLRAVGSAASGVAAMLLAWFGWNGLLFVPPLLAAAILVVPLAPHAIGSNGLRFWTFTLWAAFGVTLGFVSVLLFVIGVSAILEMVRYLFGIGLSSDAYEHVYATAMLFVGPLFALGRIPRDLDEEAAIGRSDRFTTGVAVLQNWVALPLVLAAAVILHLYVAKILATGEVPKNQIGWIVSLYTVFVLSLRVAAAPFLATGGVAQRLFGRVWLSILIMPTALLCYAVWLRIGAEGVTPERYYLALGALAAATIVLAQAFPPIRGDIRVISAVPIALLAASSFGPWGVKATVGRSQSMLIARDFAAGADGQVHPEALDDRQRDILRSRVSALAEVDSLPRLRPMMSVEARSHVDEAGTETAVETAYGRALGVDYGAGSPVYVTFSSSRRAPLDVAGFDRVQTDLDANESQATLDTLSTNPAAVVHEGQIVLRIRGIVDRVDPAPISERIGQGGGTGAEPIAIDVKTSAGRSIRLYVTSFVRSETAVYPISARFDVAFRADEWPTPVSPSLGGDGNRQR